MRKAIQSLLWVFGLTVLILYPAQLSATTARVTLPSGKQIFVSGMNLAWISYANDIVNLDTAKFNTALKRLHSAGANSMRVWLSTNGANDPVFTNGYVSGPNSNTIATIQQMLKIANKDSMLLCLCLLTHNFMQAGQGGDTAKNRIMLTTDSGLSEYINNYLVPVVKAVGKDENLLCWEVCNEPEGMVESIGWTNARITKANVQKFTARIAAAIHKNVPGILVSTGAVTAAYTTNASGCTNWYSDTALKAIDSDTSAYLDFYMAHYYPWNGSAYTPFKRICSYWGLSKPFIIGEFPAHSWDSTASKVYDASNNDAANIDTLYAHLYNTGYAGGMSWDYFGDSSTINGVKILLGNFASCSTAMAKIKDYDGVSFSDTLSDNKFYVIVSAGNGGTVTTSLTGRIDSAAIDTLKAVALTGYTFSGWTGDTTSSSTTLILKVTKDMSVTANFTPSAGTNLIDSGSFSDSTLWSFYTATGNTASVGYSSGYAAVTISTADTLNYHIQLTQGGIPLDSGVSYELTFDAWAAAARSIMVGLSSAVTWHWEGGATVTLTTTKTSNKIIITPDSTTTAGILQFNLGASKTAVYIDNVTLVKSTGSYVINPSSDLKSSQAIVRRVGSKIFWTFPQTLASDGTLKFLSASGRELSCLKLKAGATSCIISAPEHVNGVVFMTLESGKLHDVKSLLLTH